MTESTNRWLRLAQALTLGLLVSACGGGGGDSAAGNEEPAVASRSQALAVAVAPSSGNGLYALGATTTFPTATYQSRNYWVDVAFTTNAPVTTGLTIWSAADTPAATAAAGSSVNLGVKFKSDIDGFITGIRFYKGAINTGTHVGALWSSTGVQLASATFTDESATGWQQVLFASPVPIVANTVYVASYLAPKGGYSLNDAYFATVNTDTPPLHALKSSGNGGNGVYAYGSTATFPTATYQNRNYWVDVMFVPVLPPPIVGTIWPASAVPTVASVNATGAVNLGVKFKSDLDGFITGVRFYKGAANTGTHVGTLWSDTGEPLASATFTNETASGWQQVTFATPVAVTANTVYVASYLAPNGRYAVDERFFAAKGVDNPPLHALANGVGAGLTPLYDASTVLEPGAVEDTATALITRFADRARDRHAREAVFHIYDHYLSWYWEERTATIEIIDKVAKGGTDVVFNVYTLRPLFTPEFRAFYRGVTTVAEYSTNVKLTRVGTGTNPYQYTTTLKLNTKEGNRPIKVGDRMEVEVSQFIQSPTHGRANYYGTAVLYIVGQGGLVPWEGQGASLDSFPLPKSAWMGGGTTLPYQYSNEPLFRFIGIPGNMASVSAQPFMLGRRLHHTDFTTGSHSELPTENPVYTEQVGKVGPQFYATSCVGCHVNNGRSIPPDLGVVIANAVTKVGTADGSPDPALGSSLQPFRVGGVGEASIEVSSYTTTHGTYADGTAYELRKPNYLFRGVTPAAFSVRSTPPLVGLGLLEAVPESVIAALADPTDANGDGISGRIRTVVDPETGKTRLGRFGWKASQARISHQVANALNADMGITTSIFTTPDCGTAQSGCGTAGVKLSNADLANMVRYVSLLGVAARRDLKDAQALQGQALFSSAGCTGCHTTALTTSSLHPFAELRSQTIRPYTDLLLHDMGVGLADTLPEGGAKAEEWRTAPLWSIGLNPGVAGGLEAYLHDGRARNLSEAILWHGGEGEASKEAYRTMNTADRAALLKFIRSL